ncbi:MAG TPA: DUF3667 domain-containing protein [Longimicrobium sp.]|nr:DUF3667 domain-containing protein [Longimicrobium sp.]
MTSTAVSTAGLAPSAEAVPDTPSASAAVDACPSCGAAIAERYCPRCGERRIFPGDAALARFFREAFEEVLDVDSRTLRTLRALAFRPGVLTREYLAGRRRLYLGPLKLYLGTFAVTMLIIALIPSAEPHVSSDGGFTRALERLMDQLLAAIAAAQHVTPAQAKQLLSESIQRHINWVSLVLPLVFGGFVHAMFFRRRGWFSENLVFATHYSALNYLVGIAMMPVQLAFGEGVMAAFSAVAFLAMLVYLAVAVRRVYGAGRWGAAWRSFVLIIAFSIAQMVMGLLALCTATAALLYF